MRHGKKHNHLGRKAEHRHALLKNLSIALITYKRITTTVAKAKALRVHAEPLITKAKDDTTHNRRVVFSYLQNKEAIKELFGAVREKIADRPGGYLRIIKIGHRKSDGAEMAMIEFVDFNEVYTLEGKTAKKSRRRRGTAGSGKGKAGDEVVDTAVLEDTIEETPIEDYPIEEADAAAEATEDNKEENQ
jgi:large subunit ribosomal protein L17